MERELIAIPAKEQLDMPFPRRVAAYCRVSTLFEEQATSLAAQIQYWETQIDQNPMWENAGIYAERVLSRRNPGKYQEGSRVLSSGIPGNHH